MGRSASRTFQTVYKFTGRRASESLRPHAERRNEKKQTLTPRGGVPLLPARRRRGAGFRIAETGRYDRATSILNPASLRSLDRNQIGFHPYFKQPRMPRRVPSFAFCVIVAR